MTKTIADDRIQCSVVPKCNEKTDVICFSSSEALDFDLIESFFSVGLTSSDRNLLKSMIAGVPADNYMQVGIATR